MLETEINVTPALVAEHGLTPEEYARIRRILGREPNLTELGIFSVMWSEHCSYKSSRVHLKRLPTRAPQVLQGPGENAGAVDVGDGLAAVFKIESHNHPSYVEPFQGAATGRWRHPPRYFHDGCAAHCGDGLAALRHHYAARDTCRRTASTETDERPSTPRRMIRPKHRAQSPPARRRRARHRLLRQLFRRAHGRR